MIVQQSSQEAGSFCCGNSKNIELCFATRSEIIDLKRNGLVINAQVGMVTNAQVAIFFK